MNLLRQSTARTIHFGPFLDATDGVTLETGLATALDHATTGIMIGKNGGTLAVRNQGSASSPSVITTATTYDARGLYKVSLDAVDTNTLGDVIIIYTDPLTTTEVWERWTVIPANVYDAFVLGTDKMWVDAVELNSDPTAAANAAALARTVITGTVQAGSTVTSVIVGNLSVTPGSADQFKGLILKFKDGTTTQALRGQGTDITASGVAGSPDVVTLTVSALTTAPVNGDTFTIS